MLQRFCGPDGRIRLVEALEIQPIISGDAAMAEAISGRVEVKSFEPGSGIIEESAPDNDLYFILAGVVSIRVAGREVAVRAAGQHVGEMALLYPGRPRSASAVAFEEVVVARISAADFTALADANPRLWRNVARVLAERLRERNRFVSPSNPRPAMFVGCSTESLPRNFLYDSRACGQIPRHSGLEPESRRFESNNDLMHILINSGFRRNDENFDFVHVP